MKTKITRITNNSISHQFATVLLNGSPIVWIRGGCFVEMKPPFVVDNWCEIKVFPEGSVFLIEWA